jgi:hypothetical protein
MTRALIRPLLLVALLAQAACILVPMGKRAPTRPEERDPRSPTTLADGRGDQPGFGLKPVVGKQPPSVLLARDGTQCTVSEEKFERVILGTSVWCVWTKANEHEEAEALMDLVHGRH